MKKEIRNKYTAVIGLEVHAQLLTKTKIYNTDSTEYGLPPNTNISPITLAHPGTLPKLNKKVVEYAIKMGLACESEISREMVFDRKNYFYPDLPKGYQITQDRTPICIGGFIEINDGKNKERRINLTRIHIEEDAGKSIHLQEEIDTLVDFNRAGVPLIEIVTEPEIRTSEEAYFFLTEIRKLVRYLEICDGNMEEGSLRCDANISVMLNNSKSFGKKVEVKNMNSIRNVQRAIEFEITRQIETIESGGQIVSQTRGFDSVEGTTTALRQKEELNDYRYFPDPDLSPLYVSEEWLNEILKEMPKLPKELRKKFLVEYQLSEYDVQVLTNTKEIAIFFEELCKLTNNYKAASNWIMGPIKSYLNEYSKHINEINIDPKNISQIIELVDDNKMSFSTASQKLFPNLINSEKSAITLAKELDLLQSQNTDELEEMIENILQKYPDKVKTYKNGQKGILGMFMGEIMKQSKGKINPKLANKLLIDKLN